MASLVEILTEVLEPVVTDLGFEFVGCEWLPQMGSMLRIYVDKLEGGITVGECDAVGKQVRAVLLVTEGVPEGFRLEISSPGLDRPLFTKTHYEKVLGKKVKVKCEAAQAGRKNFCGILEAVEEDSIRVLVDGEAHEIPWAAIAKANLVFEFDNKTKR